MKVQDRAVYKQLVDILIKNPVGKMIQIADTLGVAYEQAFVLKGGRKIQMGRKV